MQSPEQLVLKFHQKYGHLISNNPNAHIPGHIKDLRKNLIQEEFNELMLALKENNLVEIADGLADLVYVVVGTAISYGIPFDRIFLEVHNSNMTKTPSKAYEGQKYGKVNPKGPDFKKPEIDQILRQPYLSTELEKINDSEKV
jgi:predicted HAD superfamily Cof-like phosphohydrolase